MKKILLILCLLCSFVVNAKHMEFMGIPIDGTITTFQKKLSAKGWKISSENKSAPSGVRVFTGRFAGRKVDLGVFYDTSTKTVYQVRVVISDLSDEGSDDEFDYFRDMLIRKYANVAEIVEDDADDYYMLLRIMDGTEPIGGISIEINEYDGYYNTLYAVWIDYSDLTNLSKIIDKRDRDVLKDL